GAAEQLRGARDDAIEEVHADGEIRTVDQRGAARLYDLPHSGLLALPAGSAFDQGDAGRGRGFHVGRHGGGRGEVDGHAVAGEEPRGVADVGRGDNDADLEARGAGALLEHASHRAVTEQGDLHKIGRASCRERVLIAVVAPAGRINEEPQVNGKT